MNLVSLVGTNGTRRPPSQQSSFHSSKNHSRHQSASAPPSTPRNVCQMTEIEAPCIRKLVNVRLSLLEISHIVPYKIRIARALDKKYFRCQYFLCGIQDDFLTKRFSLDGVNIVFCTIFIATLLLDGLQLLKS